MNPPQEIANSICRIFHVAPVAVDITPYQRSYFDYDYHGKPTILISVDKTEILVDLMCHEVAHYLQYVRFPSSKLVHSPLYSKILNAVVLRIFPMPVLYHWNREYICIQRFAKNMGYIDKIIR